MEYRISYDLSTLEDLPARLDALLRPILSGVVGKTANAVYTDWVDKVAHAGGKGGIRDAERDAYANSISVSYKEGDLSALVYTPYEPASLIEEGRPAYDLKAMLNTSTKVRLAKNGKRYLIIPFSHGTPGSTVMQAMPKNIHKQAEQMGLSRVTGKTWISNGFGGGGIYTERSTYSWDKKGNTINPNKARVKGNISIGALPAGLAPKLAPHHATDIYAGMRRFDTSAGKAKSSKYLTFRVMVEGSSKWIVPARPGLYIVRDVVLRGQTFMNSEVGAALK